MARGKSRMRFWRCPTCGRVHFIYNRGYNARSRRLR